MIRRPPRSTLFPTRRSSDLLENARQRSHWRRGLRGRAAADHRRPQRTADQHSQRPDRLVGDPRDRDLRLRSEEHTSELQSPCNLVCRLLLEKKNNEVATITT